MYSAVRGNGHRSDRYLRRPGTPGRDGVPKLCTKCSAPIYTACTSCQSPILGETASAVVIGSATKTPIPWFCQECGKPYLWASPEQMRAWVENRLKFDQELDEDIQDELLGVLAVLSPGEPDAPPMDFSGFKSSFRRLPAVYEEVKPYLPMLRELFGS